MSTLPPTALGFLRRGPLAQQNAPQQGQAFSDWDYDVNMELIDAAIQAGGGGSSTVFVNGVKIENPNFNDSLPASPGNLAWSVDADNNVAVSAADVFNLTLGDGNSKIQFLTSQNNVTITDGAGSTVVLDGENGIQLNSNTGSQIACNDDGSVTIIDAFGSQITFDNSGGVQLFPAAGGTFQFNSGVGLFQGSHGGNLTLDSGGVSTFTLQDNGNNSIITGNAAGLSALWDNSYGIEAGSSGFIIKTTGSPAAGKLLSTSDTNGTTAWLAQSALSIAYSQVTGKPTLPANTPATTHEFFTAYNSSTGAFTAAQPDFSDLSGQADVSQVDNLNIALQGDGTVLSSTAIELNLGNGSGQLTLNTQTANTGLFGPSTGSAATPTFRAMVVADMPTSGTWAFAGTISGNLTFSGTPVFSHVPTWPNQTANLVFAGPSTGSAAAPGFRSLVLGDLPSGYLWSNLGNASAALTLANGANATTFNQTSAVDWTWANTTAATSSAATFLYAQGSATSTSVVLSINVSVGDLVLVNCAGSANTTVTCTDNASGGSNTYTLYQTETTASFGKIYSLVSATKAATAITVAFSAGTMAVSIVVVHGGSYTIGNLTSGGGGTTIQGLSSAAANANSVWLALAHAQPASTSESISTGFTIEAATTPNSGTSIYYSAIAQQTTIQNSALQSVSATYTVNGTSFLFCYLIEIVGAAAATSSQSPIMQLSSNYWNGSASATDTWAIQNAIGNETNGQPILKFTHSGSPGVANIEFDTNAAFVNATAATSSTGQSSPSLQFAGQYWNGSVSAADVWSVQNVVANGSNGIATLTFSHIGTSGNAGISGPAFCPNIVLSGYPTSSAAPTGLYNIGGAPFILNNGGTYDLFIGAFSGGTGTNRAAFIANKLTFVSNATLGFSSSTVLTSQDTGISRVAAGVVGIGTGAQGNTGGNLQLNNITSYNAETTAGVGVAYERGSTAQKAETGADTSVLSVTPASAAGVYRIAVVISVSAASAATLGWTATWTDSNGHAQAPTNLALSTAGSATLATTVSAAANGTYYGEWYIDVNNAGTAIVIKTTFSGTSIAYKISATIERMQ